MKKKLININSLFTIVVLGTGFIIFIFVLVLAYNWYQTSCWKDHSKSVKVLGLSMEKNVAAFFKEHQRFPSLKESENIFVKSECNSIEQTWYSEDKNDANKVYQQLAAYNCSYKSNNYKFALTVQDLTKKSKSHINAYTIGFSQGNTHCRASFHKTGELISSFSCQQFACFKLDH